MAVDIQDIVDAGEAGWLCEDHRIRNVLKFIPKKKGREADVSYRLASGGKTYQEDLEVFARRAVCLIK